MGKNRKSNNKENVHHRSKYVDHSQSFLKWVKGLELEKTFFGKFAFQMEEKYSLKKLSSLFLFCFVLAFLIIYDFEVPHRMVLGQQAIRDMRSPMSFEIVDQVATHKKQKEEEEAQPPVFDFDPRPNQELVNKFLLNSREFRLDLEEMKWPRSRSKRRELISQLVEEKRDPFEKAINRSVSEEHFKWLLEKRFSIEVENVIVDALDMYASRQMVEGVESYLRPGQSQLIMRSIAREDGRERLIQRDQITDLDNKSDFSFSGIYGFKDFPSRDRRVIGQFVRSLLSPSLTLNKQETEARIKAARESVLPVVIAVKKNQLIIREGQAVQPIHLSLLNEIQKQKAGRKQSLIALSVSLLFFLLILVFFSYLKRFSLNRVRVQVKEISIMAVVTLTIVGLTKLFFVIMEAAFLSKFGKQIPQEFFMYLAPVAAATMMVGLLLVSGEVVWIFSVFITLALSFMVDAKFSFLIVTILGSITAARSVHNCHSRNDIYKAGVRVGLVNAITIFLISLFSYFGTPELIDKVIWLVPAGFFSGILSSMIVMTLIPLLESLFNVVTDVKLLELSNLNHPLLKDMVVKAPGTYHHSLMVGAMCEAAGEKIGANPLLAKVMAYYHDIGKMEHANYFIENQRPGHNPHDFVTPYMSKTILIAHVKDGAELGLEHKLGKPIIDGILQHHGTSLISYFYNKALKNQKADNKDVKEEDFRYPGPKPQFKEAALVMLADSVEAAARSLDEPTQVRLQNIVDNIIHRKFTDGQLEECNLTLKDLNTIRQTFHRIILGIYHQRIDYPKGPDSDEPTTFPKTSSGSRGPVRA